MVSHLRFMEAKLISVLLSSTVFMPRTNIHAYIRSVACEMCTCLTDQMKSDLGDVLVFCEVSQVIPHVLC